MSPRRLNLVLWRRTLLGRQYRTCFMSRFWRLKFFIAARFLERFCTTDQAFVISSHQSRHLIFVDPCIIVKFIQKNPTKCNNVSKFYYSIFMWSSTCFERHTAHHQEPKTALAASGFSYVEGCWTCSWWTLSGTQCLTTSTNYTSNNLPRMKNQRLPVQF